MLGSQRSLSAPRSRSAGIGERRNWVIACVKATTARLRAHQLLQICISAFLRGYSHRTGWRGEMRHGLLNDVRVLDKALWLLMVERCRAGLRQRRDAYRTRSTKPLLWSQLQVSRW